MFLHMSNPNTVSNPDSLRSYQQDYLNLVNNIGSLSTIHSQEPAPGTHFVPVKVIEKIPNGLRP